MRFRFRQASPGHFDPRLPYAQMTESVTSAAETALARHSPAALRDLAATLGSYVPDGGSSHDEWVRRIASVWNEPASAMRLAGGLPETTRNLLAVLAWGPMNGSIDCQDLTRIARSLGSEPDEVIAGAVAFGAIVPVAPSTETLPLAARKKLVESGHCDSIAFVIWPTLVERLPAPEIGRLTSVEPLAGETRPSIATDAADWAVRLAALWQAAMIAPLRRTQSGGLHKKDRDQILREPALAEPPADWPGGQPAWLQWVVEAFVPCAVRLGLLSEESDSLRAVPLDRWADDSLHLPERFARVVTATLRPDPFATDTQEASRDAAIAWLPSILLADLAARPENDWTPLEPVLEEFAELLGQQPSPPEPPIADTTQPTDDSVMVKTRTRKKVEIAEAPAPRPSIVAPALRFWILGPARLAGLIETGTAPDGSVAVRATAQSRFLTGQGAPPPPQPVIEKALFLQPNLEGILYRQAVTGQSLPRYASLVRFTGIGPVLQIRLDETWSRLMFGAGLAREEAEARLAAMSAVEISRSVLETFRTWAGKSDRVRIHPALTLLETQTAEDREALQALAAERGLAAFAIGDRLLAIENADTIPFDALRLQAQQDQAQKPALCIRPIADGTLLEVDTARSDLALDPELARFADSVSDAALSTPAESAARFFRVDRESLTQARQSGVTTAWLDRFFRKRSGEGVPASIALLWSCVSSGLDSSGPPALRVKRTCVIRTDDELTLDGLMSLETTAHLIAARLGPTAAEVEPRDLDELVDIARELGIVLKS